MVKVTREKLEEAYRKEKDHRVGARMLAVHMVHFRKMSIDDAAANLLRCPRWVRNWLERFETGGLEGLRDLPRSGRPPKISPEAMDGVLGKVDRFKTTPAELQQVIHKETGTKMHRINVRKIMQKYGLSPKGSQRVHINRATKAAVKSWQYRLKKRISRLEKDGFVIAMEDEAFFIHDVKSGRKYWSPVGVPITVPYTGSHKRITAYGSITMDGRQFFRTGSWFNAPTFVAYLKAMQRHFGKVAVMVDRASPHRAKAVRTLLHENKNIKIIYLPKGSPYLNAVEECWHQGKRNLLVSEYYKTFLDMHSAVSQYYRTARFNLDLIKFFNRKAELFCKNF